MTTSSQVLVIGGGPAGSSAAAMLARSGLSVRLLEREVFPRYHIGESLAPSCKPLLKLSGALEKVEQQGFVVKRGALVKWTTDDWRIEWSELPEKDVKAFQVEREHFDHVLLKNAVDQGVDVIEGATVRSIIFDGERPVAAEWVDKEKNSHTERFDFLVDASGRTGVMSRQHLNNRRRHKIFQNIAVWGYWKNFRLLPDSPEGGIQVIAYPEGWWWGIPLANGPQLSLGFVTHKDIFRDQRPQFDSLETMYMELIKQSESVQYLLEGAEYVPGIRSEQDYSYVADAFCGPGYLSVGDAACFLDPLLSTGVHLGMYSSTIAAAAIGSVFRGEVSEADALGFFEYSYRRAYARLLALVSRMYESYDGKESFFWQSQQLIHEKAWFQTPKTAFIEIVTGLSDIREAIRSDERAVTSRLLDEAEHVLDTAAERGAPGGEHGLDFSSHRIGPEEDTEPFGGLRLVIQPMLGLKKVTQAENSDRDVAQPVG